MNLIDEAFGRMKQEGKKALMPFITMGDPDLQTTIEIIKTLESAGADMLELGVPYSDPLADGPVIQRAAERSLLNHVTLEDCIRAAGQARQEGVKIPFILFTYYNPVMQFGLEAFIDLVASNSISGLIIPDLPIEEDSEVRKLSEAANIHLVPLVAPSSKDRVARIASGAKGFVYCVSSLGVTGVRSEFDASVDEFLATVRQATDTPLAIGFGISNREQVARFEKLCDGVIVGSAIVRIIEEAGPLLRNESTREEGLKRIGDFTAQLKG